MPIATNLVYTSMNNGKKISKNISFCNPEATDEKLAEFMSAVSSLSQNTFVSLERVNKHALEMPVAAPKLELSVSPTTVDMTEEHSTQVFTVTTNSSGAISAELISDEDIQTVFDSTEINGNEVTVTRSRDSIMGDSFTVTLRITVAADGKLPAGTVDATITCKNSMELPQP